jgi:hypothetical protein
MRYTKYIQGCLAALEQEQEYETDLRLATLVRIQHLTERIAQLNSPDDPAEEVAGLPTAPISAYVSAFHSELDRIRNELPHDLRNDSRFLLLDQFVFNIVVNLCSGNKHIPQHSYAPVV